MPNSIAEHKRIHEVLGITSSGISGGSGVSVHDQLTGLLDDDHPQYLLVNGSRAMGAALNMGGFAISNVGNVDGVDVSTLSSSLSSHTGDSSIHFTEASIDHTAIQNIGSNTHSQIDTHISNSSVHFTVGSIDHGSIGGLSDDDHTGYLLVNGTRAMTGDLNMGFQNIDWATDLTASGLSELGRLGTLRVWKEGTYDESRWRRIPDANEDCNIYYYDTRGIQITTPLQNLGDVVIYKFELGDTDGAMATGYVRANRGSSAYYDTVQGYCFGRLKYSTILTGRDASGNTIIWIEPKYIRNQHFRLLEVVGWNTTHSDASNVPNLMTTPTVEYLTSSDISSASGYIGGFYRSLPDFFIASNGNASYAGTVTHVDTMVVQLTGTQQVLYKYLYFPEVTAELNTYWGIAEFEFSGSRLNTPARAKVYFNVTGQTVQYARCIWSGPLHPAIPNVSIGWKSDDVLCIRFGDGINTFGSSRFAVKDVTLIGINCQYLGSLDYSLGSTSTNYLVISKDFPLQWEDHENFFTDSVNGDTSVRNTLWAEEIVVSGLIDAVDGILFGSSSSTTNGTVQWDGSNLQVYSNGWKDLTLESGTFVSASGNPNDNQIAVWTASGIIEGDANFTWDGSDLTVMGRLGIGIAPANVIHANQDLDGQSRVRLNNTSVGDSAEARIEASTSNDGVLVGLIAHNDAQAGSVGGVNTAGATDIYTTSATSLRIRTADSAPMYLMTNNTLALTLDTSQNATFGGSITLPATDILQWTGQSKIYSSANNYIEMTNAAGAGVRLDVGSVGAQLTVYDEDGTAATVVANSFATTGGSSWTDSTFSLYWATSAIFQNNYNNGAVIFRSKSMTSGTTGTVDIYSGVRSGAGNSGAVAVYSGTAGATTGNVSLSSGASSGGSSGSVTLNTGTAVTTVGSIYLKTGGVTALTIDANQGAAFANYVRLAGTSNETAGNIRWDGSNFQGYNGVTWVNLDTQGGVAGDVFTSGNPSDGQIAIWTVSGVIEGDANFTWDGSAQIFTIGTDPAFVVSGENVGIGKRAPDFDLEVYEDAPAATTIIGATSASAATGYERAALIARAIDPGKSSGYVLAGLAAHTHNFSADIDGFSLAGIAVLGDDPIATVSGLWLNTCAATPIRFFTGLSHAMTIDGTSQYIGVGTSVPDYRLHTQDILYPLKVERLTSITNLSRMVGVFQHTTTGDMVDGFGATIRLNIRDDEGIDRTIGELKAKRSGGDTSGITQLTSLIGGVRYDTLTVSGECVGIGTEPRYELDVLRDQASGATTINLENNGEAGAVKLQLEPGTDNPLILLAGGVDYDLELFGSPAGETAFMYCINPLAIGTTGGSEVHLGTNDTKAMTIGTSQQIKITNGLANGQYLNIDAATVELTGLSGATATATDLIPAGCLFLGLTTRVTTAITGATSFDIGASQDSTIWGDSISVSAGTTTDISDFTSNGIYFYMSAQSVVLTANGSSFTGGAVRITVHYLSCSAPTS